MGRFVHGLQASRKVFETAGPNLGTLDPTGWCLGSGLFGRLWAAIRDPSLRERRPDVDGTASAIPASPCCRSLFRREGVVIARERPGVFAVLVGHFRRLHRRCPQRRRQPALSGHQGSLPARSWTARLEALVLECRQAGYEIGALQTFTLKGFPTQQMGSSPLAAETAFRQLLKRTS